MVDVLVEGESDAGAVRVLLGRHGLTGSVEVVPMGGATNIGHALRGRRNATVLGLCDEAEAIIVALALHREGRWELPRPATVPGPGRHRPTAAEPAQLRRDLAGQGFFVCRADLEEELIRALGIAGAETILADHGALGSFRTFQGQPDQRGRPDPARLRRFLGAGSGRKIRFAAAFTAALPDDRLPPPLANLVVAVESTLCGDSDTGAAGTGDDTDTVHSGSGRAPGSRGPRGEAGSSRW